MRLTKISFNAKTNKLVIEYQTPNQSGDGWIKAGGEGKFDPGDGFRAAFAALDPICAFTHELLTRGFETVDGLLVPAHPVQARSVTLIYKAKSSLVEVMISGVRSISRQPGSYSLPGVKRFKNDGDREEGELFISEAFTRAVDVVEEHARAILPAFLKVLGQKVPTLLDDGQGDGAAALVTVGFDNEAGSLAKQTLGRLSRRQIEVIQRCGMDPAPPAKGFRTSKKSKPFRVDVQQLLDESIIVHNPQTDVLRLGELGQDILQLVTTAEA